MNHPMPKGFWNPPVDDVVVPECIPPTEHLTSGLLSDTIAAFVDAFQTAYDEGKKGVESL